jgi:hypothetical protein
MKKLLLLVLLTACEQAPEKYLLQPTAKPMVVLTKNHYTNENNEEIFEVQTFDGDETYYCEIPHEWYIVLQKNDTIKNYFIKIK